MSEQAHDERARTTRPDREQSDVEEVFALALEAVRRLEDVEETLRGRLDPVLRPDIGLTEMIDPDKKGGTAAPVVVQIREIDLRVSAVADRLRATLGRLSI